MENDFKGTEQDREGIVENMSEELLSEVGLAELDYERKICIKCPSKRMKERDCGILFGSTKKSCEWMGRAVNQRKKIKILCRRMLATILTAGNILSKPAIHNLSDDLNRQADELEKPSHLNERTHKEI